LKSEQRNRDEIVRQYDGQLRDLKLEKDGLINENRILNERLNNACCNLF
jgi:hypothetical protein